MSLLKVDDLSVAFGTRRVVDRVSFTLDRGETLALVGESGSGKSLTALSLLQLLPRGGNNPTGTIVLDGSEIIGAAPDTLHKVRGDVAGIVFQEPMTSLNPLHRIGRQVAEAITCIEICLAPRSCDVWSAFSTRRDFRMRRTAWMRFRINCPAASDSG